MCVFRMCLCSDALSFPSLFRWNSFGNLFVVVLLSARPSSKRERTHTHRTLATNAETFYRHCFAIVRYTLRGSGGGSVSACQPQTTWPISALSFFIIIIAFVQQDTRARAYVNCELWMRGINSSSNVFPDVRAASKSVANNHNGRRKNGSFEWVRWFYCAQSSAIFRCQMSRFTICPHRIEIHRNCHCHFLPFSIRVTLWESISPSFLAWHFIFLVVVDAAHPQPEQTTLCRTEEDDDDDDVGAAEPCFYWIWLYHVHRPKTRHLNLNNKSDWKMPGFIWSSYMVYQIHIPPNTECSPECARRDGRIEIV